nr:MAG TPA: hypothetical protein [Caudoviricetes sp.]
MFFVPKWRKNVRCMANLLIIKCLSNHERVVCYH